MSNKSKRERPPENIPWRVHERDMCRLARAYKVAIKALAIALIVAAAFAGFEAWLRHREHEKWLNYLEQYDFESYDFTQDGEGLNIIGDGNGVNYVPAFESEGQSEEEPRDGQGQGAEKGDEKMSENET